MKKQNPGKKIIRWALAGLTAVLLFIFTFALGIYFLGWNNFFVQKLCVFIPYPAAVIDSAQWLSFRDYSKKATIISRYHNLQDIISPSDDYNLNSWQGEKYFQVAKKNILSQMIKDALIQKSASRYNISVTQEDLDKEISKIAANNGGIEKLTQKLNQVYKINLKYFTSQVVKPRLIQEKLRLYLVDQGEITVEIESFQDWINQKAKTTRIFIPLPQYYWDSDQGKVMFRDPAMNQYENTTIEPRETIAS
ncbi:MAG: hypothetical protein ABIC19_03455 [Patescibacteria group bacterium]|nr:SurA N-terminal domain-containing protein [Patescibacteria group bacterium]